MHSSEASIGVTPPDMPMGQSGKAAIAPVLNTSLRLLWVDDCRPLLDLYKTVFERFGFEVVTTCSAQEALEYVASAWVDAAILDFDMPEMNGAMLASLIRRVRPTLPLILHSGNPDLPHYARLCVDAVCPKTSPREELLATIEEVAGQPTAPHPSTAPSLSFSPSSKSI